MIIFEVINDNNGTEKLANYTWKALVNFNVIASGKIRKFPRLQKDAKALVRLALEEWERQ